MTAYRYVALDAQGKQRKGFIEGDSPRLVRQDLRAMGWHPLDVVEERSEAGRKQARFSLQSTSPRDLQLFTQQLATLLRSGLPLEEALKAIAEQGESRALKRLVLDIRSKVLEGQPLSAALARHPSTFDNLYRATVGAGEASGKLDAVLSGLITHIDRQQRLARKTQAAMVYPIVLTLVSILVVIGLMQFVVPEIVQVFRDTGQALPGLTVALIAASDFLRDYWAWLLAALVATVTGTYLLLSHPGPKAAWHRLLLSLPGIRRFIRTVQTARLTRTLAILVSSGVPLLESLRIAVDVLDSIPYRDALAEVSDRVREGEPLSRALARTQRLPPITVSLIASGETGGNLGDMLASAADDQETEIAARTEMFISLFEPLLILVMGGAVLLVVLAMLLPIFEMNQLVQ
jgi:general secretion pathway protein F